MSSLNALGYDRFNETLALKWMYLSDEVSPVMELGWEGREQILAVFLDPYQSWLLLSGSKVRRHLKCWFFWQQNLLQSYGVHIIYVYYTSTCSRAQVCISRGKKWVEEDRGVQIQMRRERWGWGEACSVTCEWFDCFIGLTTEGHQDCSMFVAKTSK